jgi:hypothetical protein
MSAAEAAQSLTIAECGFRIAESLRIIGDLVFGKLSNLKDEGPGAISDC